LKRRESGCGEGRDYDTISVGGGEPRKDKVKGGEKNRNESDEEKGLRLPKGAVEAEPS